MRRIIDNSNQKEKRKGLLQNSLLEKQPNVLAVETTIIS